MIINVSEILKHNGATKKIVFNEVISDLESNGLRFVNPIDFNGELTNNGRLLSLVGNLKTNVIVNCDKCLKEFKHYIDINIDEKFSADEEQEDITLLVNNTISIDDIIKDNILINLPMQFICDDSCKGLCYLCGTDKNLNECDCKDEDVDPRFLKLKDLFK